MQCEVIQVPQGSERWDDYRSGRITASILSNIMADKKTKRYTKQLSRLIIECSGGTVANDDGPWYSHGKDMEPRALGAWEWRFNQTLQHDIFLISHKYNWLSCSPDGMTADYSEGVEIKCRKVWQQYKSATQNATRAEDNNQPTKIAPAEHRHQLQGAMWVTGLDSWWYVNYYENAQDGTRKLHRVLVPRDDKLISEMEVRCVAVMREVYETVGVSDE